MQHIISIPKPYTALTLREDGLYKTVSWLCGSVTFGPDGLPVSLKAQGTELLASPVRFRTLEDGEEGVWDTDYPANEGECFIQEHDDAHVVLCGAAATKRFVIDTAVTVSYDGNITFEARLASRGRTVYQNFGLAGYEKLVYRLEHLWLEVPMKAEYARSYQLFPQSVLHLADGTDIAPTRFNVAGSIPAQDTGMSFKALCWLGDDRRGLGWFASSDARWQPADPEAAMEWIHGPDTVTLRARIFDSQPRSWTAPPEEGAYGFFPICFDFGLQTTPVRPWKAPELLRGLHIDCFRKTKGNYWDYLSGTAFEGLDGNTETGFDRMSRLGVKTLILHEKWNKVQNQPGICEYTREQVRKIVAECHARGIRVLTYFGYEYSLMSTDWNRIGEKYIVRTADGKFHGGWYRVPFQREYVCCYNNEWADRWVDGIADLMDTCHTDGVYLDGTSRLYPCANESHGCGERDADGVLQDTYPVRGVRRLFERLYREVHARGGIINVIPAAASTSRSCPSSTCCGAARTCSSAISRVNSTTCRWITTASCIPAKTPACRWN